MPNYYTAPLDLLSHRQASFRICCAEPHPSACQQRPRQGLRREGKRGKGRDIHAPGRKLSPRLRLPVPRKAANLSSDFLASWGFTLSTWKKYPGSCHYSALLKEGDRVLPVIHLAKCTGGNFLLTSADNECIPPKRRGLIALALAFDRSQIILSRRSPAWARGAGGGRGSKVSESSERGAGEGLCLCLPPVPAATPQKKWSKPTVCDGL